MLCFKCSLDKPDTAFNWKNKAKGKRHGHCRDCQRAYKRAYYEKDRSAYKESVLRSNMKLKQRNRRYLWDYLVSHPCVDCGEADPIKLEFDHLRDKEVCVKKMINRKRSLMAIDREIAKCEVVCANCHRVRTADRGGWYSDLRI